MALHILHDHLGRSPHGLTVAATSAADGYPAINGEDGSLHTFWRATTTGDQTLTYDAGAGFTKTVEYVVLARADLLAAIACHVAVQWSTDMAAWTDAFTPLTPIVTGSLSGPDSQHFVREFAGIVPKRGWRIRFYGTPSAVATLAGWQLGTITTLASGIKYGRSLSMSRALLGAELQGDLSLLAPATMTTTLTALAALNPGFPLEQPVESESGALFGVLPHWVYDPVGNVFRSATPYLLPMGFLSPGEVRSISVTGAYESGPTVRWRQLV